jgi:Rieske Fe-S protein
MGGGQAPNPSKEDPVSDLTRRSFVRNSAVTAAGMTAVGALTAEVASADTGAAAKEPVVAYVSDPSTGEISVMQGEREVVLRDRKLARDIARAAR